MYSFKELLSIIEVCKQTILTWERQGYIPYPQKNGNKRQYTEEQLQQILAFKQARKRLPPPHKREFTQEQLSYMYYDKKMSIPDIAQQVGASFSTVASHMEAHGLARRSMSESMKLQIETKGNPFTGRYHSDETKARISHTRIAKKVAKGQNNPMYGRSQELAPGWKGGKSDQSALFFRSLEWRELRRQVFMRDSYTCQLCKDNTGGNLNAHHIKKRANYPELILEITNCITLCETCHDKVNNHEHCYTKTFNDILKSQDKI